MNDQQTLIILQLQAIISRPPKQYYISLMLKQLLVAATLLSSILLYLHLSATPSQTPSVSSIPKPSKYNSNFLQGLKKDLVDSTNNQDLKKLINNAMLNTFDTTIIHNKTGAFIITGDINAMWLRDSTNQIHPFVEFVKNDSQIDWLVQRVIERQASMIKADPYANAFNYEPEGSYKQKTDSSQRKMFGGIPFDAIFEKSIVFERKYELDSLAAFIRLSNEYFKWSQSTEFVDIKWVEAYERIIKVINEQRLSYQEEDREGDAPYTFWRTTPQPTDSLSHARGTPTAQCGLIRSAFRPSDDATTYQYFIPGNAMMQIQLKKSLALLKKVNLIGYNSRVQALIEVITPLQEEIREAIYKHGITKNDHNNDMFAYEVDCFGNSIKMDDANSPSLLSLPYLQFVEANDYIYKNTREYIWSKSNPYFFQGSKGEGIGGPHAGLNYIWPMSIIMKALTTNDKNQIKQCLRSLVNSTANTFFIHESFHKDNEYDYTRSWFAWANTMFGHLVLKTYREFPQILKQF